MAVVALWLLALDCWPCGIGLYEVFAFSGEKPRLIAVVFRLRSEDVNHFLSSSDDFYDRQKVFAYVSKDTVHALHTSYVDTLQLYSKSVVDVQIDVRWFDFCWQQWICGPEGGHGVVPGHCIDKRLFHSVQDRETCVYCEHYSYGYCTSIWLFTRIVFF